MREGKQDGLIQGNCVVGTDERESRNRAKGVKSLLVSWEDSSGSQVLDLNSGLLICVKQNKRKKKQSGLGSGGSGARLLS